MGEEDACPLLALANALAERGDLEQCNPKASAKRQRDEHSESSSKDSHYPSPTPTHGASDDSAFAVRTSKRQCRGANVAAHTAALRSDVILPRNDEDTATEDEGDDGGHHIRTYATTDTDATVSAVSQGRKGSKTQSATQLSQTSSKKKKEQKAQASSSNAQQNQKQGQGMSQTQTSSYRGVTKHRVTGKFEAHLWDPDYTRQTNGKGVDERRRGRNKGRQVYLGGFYMEVDAASAYDIAAIRWWGENATLNFDVANYSHVFNHILSLSTEDIIAGLRRGRVGGTSDIPLPNNHGAISKWGPITPASPVSTCERGGKRKGKAETAQQAQSLSQSQQQAPSQSSLANQHPQSPSMMVPLMCQSVPPKASGAQQMTTGHWDATHTGQGQIVQQGRDAGDSASPSEQQTQSMFPPVDHHQINAILQHFQLPQEEQQPQASSPHFQQPKSSAGQLSHQQENQLATASLHSQQINALQQVLYQHAFMPQHQQMYHTAPQGSQMIQRQEPLFQGLEVKRPQPVVAALNGQQHLSQAQPQSRRQPHAYAQRPQQWTSNESLEQPQPQPQLQPRAEQSQPQGEPQLQDRLTDDTNLDHVKHKAETRTHFGDGQSKGQPPRAASQARSPALHRGQATDNASEQRRAQPEASTQAQQRQTYDGQSENLQLQLRDERERQQRQPGGDWSEQPQLRDERHRQQRHTGDSALEHSQPQLENQPHAKEQQTDGSPEELQLQQKEHGAMQEWRTGDREPQEKLMRRPEKMEEATEQARVTSGRERGERECQFGNKEG